VAGLDYVGTAGVLEFLPGVVERVFPVPVLDDRMDEDEEGFTGLLSQPVDVELGDVLGAGTVLDDDAPPELWVMDAGGREGQSGTSLLSFPLRLSTASGKCLEVGYQTSDGTAEAGSDYTETSGTLVIPPGELEGTVTVPVLGDTLYEPVEDFFVDLGVDRQDAVEGDFQGRGVILNDDRPCQIIGTVPYTITQPGSYCLGRDFTTSLEDAGAAITIAASQVVLDLNGFSLRNLPVHPRNTATHGIHALNRTRITVRNGTVSGFLRGVYLQGNFAGMDESHVVEGVQADGNTHEGIAVEGSGTLVRDNRVRAVIGSHLPEYAECRGIRVMGAAAQVLDNQVFEVHGTPGSGRGYGIYVNSLAAVVHGNRIANGREVPELSTAISVRQPDVLVTDNQMSWMDQGLVFEDGGAGKYRGNATVDVALPYDGGTDIGNNH
jgi:hypothetical protein